MARFGKYFVLLSVLLLTFSVRHLQTAMAGSPRTEGKEVVSRQRTSLQEFSPNVFSSADRVLRCSSATAVGCTL